MNFAQPGPNAKIESADGVSTNCNYLRNGVYHC
jgi:hypothetical protein